MGDMQPYSILPHRQEIACQQVLVEDSSVFSIQWSVFPAALAAQLTPEMLLNRYLAYIRRCTATIIRPHCSTSGIRFSLLGSRLSLISFRPPAEEQQAVVLRISGGSPHLLRKLPMLEIWYL